MINDKLLQIAAGEVDACMLDALSTQPEHRFSPRFQRKMNHLIRKTDYPVKYLLTACAAILILALTLFATVLTLSPTVRAAVQAWLRLPGIEDIHYIFQGWSSEGNPDFDLLWVPDGFELEEGQEHISGGYYSYGNGDGRKLCFRYVCGPDAAKLYLEMNDCVSQSTTVGDVSADLYVNSIREDASRIVWTDSDTGALFVISYNGEPGDLIALAESVAITEKD